MLPILNATYLFLKFYVDSIKDSLFLPAAVEWRGCGANFALALGAEVHL